MKRRVPVFCIILQMGVLIQHLVCLNARIAIYSFIFVFISDIRDEYIRKAYAAIFIFNF
jgi:hypothetical protein